MAKRHRRQQDQARERQLPVDPQHEGDDADQLERVEGDGHRAGGEHLAEDVDVRGDPRHHLADRVAVEEAHRKALQALEDGAPQVGEAALRDHHGAVLLAVEGEELAHDGGDEPEGEAGEPGQVARPHVAVDADLQEIRLRQAEDLLDRRQEHRQPDDAPVRTDERPQPPDEPSVVGLADLLLVVARQMASSSPSRACWRNRSA